MQEISWRASSPLCDELCRKATPLADERAALRPLAPARFDASGHRTSRVPVDGYLRHGGCF
jgi:hypothetical protein